MADDDPKPEPAKPADTDDRVARAARLILAA